MNGLSTIPSGHGYSYLVAKLAKEAAEMLKDVPHVKGVAGFILQIIAIREATEAGREKSHELIDTVLRRSILVLDELLSVGKSPYREKLVRVEGKLKEYQK
ncbi:hypothetical protein H0H87_006143 [Tephrocybe sp. NHM501043]|nr:hypothetical protein H0H87_006143 [Tephrocybe sp. NHM501043]